MVEAVQAFVASLDDAQKAITIIPFDDARRVDWHNIPKPERKGLQLRDMTPEQQNLCYEVLETGLSDKGFAKLKQILALENNLKEGEKDRVDGHLRDPLRYFLTIFGDPANEGAWGWSFEGHHLSLNYVIRDGEVVCDTPSFWGANPATVHIHVEGGPEIDARTLADEEQLAFDLLASLDDAQRTRAIVSPDAPDDYRGPGTPQPPHEAPIGLPVADMTREQKHALEELLEAYASHLAGELREARMDEIDDGGFNQLYFAWKGGQQPGERHYYVVQGPTFVLELVNVQSDPAGTPANHIHSVWRSLKGDFGIAN